MKNGVVVNYQSGRSTNSTQVFLGVAETTEAALAIYKSRDWFSGDGYGSLPYWVEIVIKPNGKVFIPLNKLSHANDISLKEIISFSKKLKVVKKYENKRGWFVHFKKISQTN